MLHPVIHVVNQMRLEVKYLLYTLCLIVTTGFAGAQPAAQTKWPYWHTSMVHTAWYKRDGAPTVNFQMTQDDRGMLWFAATDGVYRFDGVRFERLSAIDGNKLKSNNTNGILAVGSALWVGYNFGGVSVFDQGKVRYYGKEEGLPEHTVYQIRRSRSGVMWLSTADGLYRLERERWRRVGLEAGLPPAEYKARFEPLDDGTIVVANSAGVYRSTRDGRQFHQIAISDKYEVMQIRADGVVLLADHAAQLFRYSVDSEQITPIILPDIKLPGSARFDGRGALWVNAEGKLNLLGPDMRVQRSFTSPENLSGNITYDFFTDRESNVWIATENGIDRIRESRLNVIDLYPKIFGWISVQADLSGVTWVSSYSATHSWSGNTYGLRPDGSWIEGLAHNVSASTRAADGSIWFGSAESLWRLQNGQWQSWPLAADLRGHDVQAIAMDAQARLWVSVQGKGVFVFHDGQWQAGGGIKSLSGRPAISIYADKDLVWFGYPANHMALLDGATLREYGPTDGLEIGNVTAMARHRSGLFVGGDQGMAVFDGNRFATMLDGEGQSLGGISSLLSTRGNELWFHGADGIVRIGDAELTSSALGKHRINPEYFNYLDGHTGKPAQMRPLAELSEAADGRLWYATSGSVGWIDPNHIVRNTLPPVSQVTGLRTDHQNYPAVPGLVLPKHTTNIELDFTAAALSIPERVRFRFRLVGLDKDWRDAGSRRAAFYTNLDPGNYHFEVMAANEDGVWSSTPGSLDFRVEPAFMQTVWFKLLCVALALSLIALWYWWRMTLMTRRVAERLGERLRERERIARTLHDSFLQSVQALMMQFDLIRYSLSATDPAQKKIEHALDSAGQVLEEGREQVLALRLNHELSGDLESALSGLGQILAPRHQSRFTLRMHGTPRPLRAMAAAEAYAIAREAMLNAFRHAQSDEVIVELRHTARQFTLQVSDRGRGMSAEIRERGHRPGHWGLTGMRERAQDAGGTLEVHSEEGRGTRITLRLPERRAYARKEADKLAATDQ
ncbi:hypothetical protein GJ699_21080 [Duganella sp. FT80W]|uniref:Histidine kinase domain-containing protein n=1 Tax=Duganella guangzhouensis TaxID=2666084 RepID=A0A6I2L750_9BURK|nr:sensor histidine kinase [Duganella guangzhouensis]MRW92496.1 hypothetical protein [Duganella guangzhouensis]